MIDWDALLLGPLNRVFGQQAEYTTPDGSSSWLITGVFDEAYTDVDVVNGEPVTTTHPCFGFPVSLMSGRVQKSGKLFVPAAPGAPLQDTIYIVKQVRNDGHGWCRLMLNLAP